MSCSHLAVCLFIYTVCSRTSRAYTTQPRWGQAAVLLNDVLFIQGGKTDMYNSYSYTSAPNTNDTLSLSLSSSFDASDPPWISANPSSVLQESQPPAVSWHTLSAFNSTGVLLFGGQSGPDSPPPLPNSADSAYCLHVRDNSSLEWIAEPLSWAGEPPRRIYHSTATAVSGQIFIIGGEKSDGSGNGISDHYIFDPSGPSFALLQASNGPPDILGHASLMLADGRLVVFGGYSPSLSSLIPFSTIWSLDTRESSLRWTQLNISSSSIPGSRRNFAAAATGRKVIIHGGSDATLQNNLSDGWLLDMSHDPPTWSRIDVLTQLGARRDHFAVSYGDSVIFGFGYGSSGPFSSPALQVYAVNLNSLVSTYDPPLSSPLPSQTLPGSVPTTEQPNTSPSSVKPGHQPTPTTNPSSGDLPDAGQGPKTGRGTTIAVAIGATLGVLVLIIGGILVMYYLRRRHSHFGDRAGFNVLANDRGPGSEDHSNPLMGEAKMRDRSLNEPVGAVRVPNSLFLGLNSFMNALAGARSPRHLAQRRDMLADEDTRDFADWYNVRKAGRNSLSFRSIVSSRWPSRAPSIASTVSSAFMRTREPSSDTQLLMRDVPGLKRGSSRLQGRRQRSDVSAFSKITYDDPFADRFGDSHDVVLSSQLSEPIYQDVEDPSMGQYLDPLRNVHAVSSHTDVDQPPSPSGSSPLSSLTNTTSVTTTPVDSRPQAGPLLGSIIAPNSQSIGRSDTWWSRFSRTAFLDRVASTASKQSNLILEIRDPNPPPKLLPINEGFSSGNLDTTLPASHEAQPAAAYENTNKSMTSVNTANTEAVERIGNILDVAQRGDTEPTRRQSSTGTSTTLRTSSGSSPGLEDHDLEADGAGNPLVTQRGYSRGLVADRVKIYERQMSRMQELPPLTNTKRYEERAKLRNEHLTSYGLVLRPSLYITNPDHGRSPSLDS